MHRDILDAIFLLREYVHGHSGNTFVLKLFAFLHTLSS